MNVGAQAHSSAREVRSEGELVSEDGLEIVDAGEVVDRIGRLGAHPFVVDEGVDDFAEVARGLDLPGAQHEPGEAAVLFEGHQPQTLTQRLAADVATFLHDVLDGVLQTFVHESEGGGTVPPVGSGNFVEITFHLCSSLSSPHRHVARIK